MVEPGRSAPVSLGILMMRSRSSRVSVSKRGVINFSITSFEVCQLRDSDSSWSDRSFANAPMSCSWIATERRSVPNA